MADKQQGRSIRELWKVFSKGDHLSDEELNRLIKSAKQGIEYLQAREERLALKATYCDLEVLRGYKWARKNL